MWQTLFLALKDTGVNKPEKVLVLMYITFLRRQADNSQIKR